ncbi:hypothetical protein [Leeuwenhoekiella sp. W20_SRS_FM14]|uniref:hypothetical protein n=1 Tax=Leeuwenhoekiella sp. W20_SRS_FM14 TaxID=3240270 RepID=UPI003F94BDEC
MKPIKYWYLAIVSCLCYILVSELKIEWGFYLKPVYFIFFYAYYYSSTKKHNITLIVFHLSSLIAEIFFLLDLNLFFDEVLYFYMIAVFAMFLFFAPILKIRSQKITKEMLLEPVLGVLFAAYLIIHLLAVFYESVPNKSLFLIGGILLFIFTAVCSLIPLRHRSPHNYKTYIIAAALLIECITGFIHYYSLSIPIILSLLNIAICFHKAAATSYFVDVHNALNDQKDYI